MFNPKFEFGFIQFIKTSFKSSEYAPLDGKNTQSCKQTNAKPRQIATSCTFMNPDMFLTAVTMYLGYQNLAKKM